jgi:hypothetical protein
MLSAQLPPRCLPGGQATHLQQGCAVAAEGERDQPAATRVGLDEVGEVVCHTTVHRPAGGRCEQLGQSPCWCAFGALAGGWCRDGAWSAAAAPCHARWDCGGHPGRVCVGWGGGGARLGRIVGAEFADHTLRSPLVLRPLRVLPRVGAPGAGPGCCLWRCRGARGRILRTGAGLHGRPLGGTHRDSCVATAHDCCECTRLWRAPTAAASGRSSCE